MNAIYVNLERRTWKNRQNCREIAVWAQKSQQLCYFRDFSDESWQLIEVMTDWNVLYKSFLKIIEKTISMAL